MKKIHLAYLKNLQSAGQSWTLWAPQRKEETEQSLSIALLKHYLLAESRRLRRCGRRLTLFTRIFYQTLSPSHKLLWLQKYKTKAHVD